MIATGPSFKIETKTTARGVVVIVESSLRPRVKQRFPGPTEAIARRLAEAFMEDERARADRIEWGKRRRRQGRMRQAAFAAAAKGQRP